MSDEVICAFGRLGTWFGCDRIGYQPDMITMAKGITSGYAPLGGVMVSDRIAAPFLEADTTFMHGITFAGHPVSCAVALANLELMERDNVLGNVLANEGAFRAALGTLEDLPWVGEIRGMGFFYAIELVKDKATKAPFEGDEANRLLRTLLSPRLFELGLICRADDRGDPVIQLSPALIAGPAEFDEIARIIRTALTDSMEAL
jgi:adenosylmethionine-8-amino-7-oxononanoate aminotransferase